MDASPIIEVEGLTKIFGGVAAVDRISFTMPRGTTMGLLGGNGAGKTTTLSMLLGLLLPSAGSIRILGSDMIRHRHRVLGRMNFASPYIDLPHRLTVRQNLDVHARLYSVPDRRRTIQRLASDLQFEALLDRPFGAMSAGQKTRVTLAKALINAPDLLLLDEPTASLDPDTGDWVRSYLEAEQRRRGMSILLASHNMAEVERLCSEILMMRGGRIVERGRPAQLLDRYGHDDLEGVFLAIARARPEPVA